MVMMITTKSYWSYYELAPDAETRLAGFMAAAQWRGPADDIADIAVRWSILENAGSIMQRRSDEMSGVSPCPYL